MLKQTSRRRFLKQLAAGSGLALGGLGVSETYSRQTVSLQTMLPDHPNFLFIITDQERYTQYFPDGWEQANLPNLGRLKSKGLAFTNAFCNSCMCSPSRSTLLTGLYPAQHHVVDTLPEAEHGASTENEPVLDPDMQNMAKMLKTAGYNVYYKGKWHVSKPQGDEWRADDLTRYGFDAWDPPDAGEDAAPENYGGGRANNDERFVEDAIAFLQTMDTSQPFALFVSLVNPHDIAGYPKNHEDDYEHSMLQGEIAPPPTVDEDLSANYKPKAHSELTKKLAAGLGMVNTPLKRNQYVNFYGNLLKHVDEQIGRVLDALYARSDGGSPLADNTLVFRFADHGEMGLSHGGLRQKMFVTYDEAIHIPIIVSNPVLFPAPQSSDALVSLVDIMPTIATLASVPNREQWVFKGADFSSVILNPNSADVQDTVMFTFDDVKAGMENIDELVGPPNRIRCIREKNWKYARYFDGKNEVAPEYEMYDLVNDPMEMENLANPDHPRYNDSDVAEQRNRLSEKLVQWEQEKLAPLAAENVKDTGPAIPEKFELWQNFPNPFNPTTRIKFSVKENCLVHLDVYNSNGQVVRTLVNEQKHPGLYTISWDGTNFSGNKVASGLYFYRLKAGHRILTKQMILQR
ncbi:MAG: sulfatase-like hydrolase/transferase [Calditrichaeota bacterium]|nr:sulfatase-like hydrolase/transferase [Calditrichota bacterium]